MFPKMDPVAVNIIMVVDGVLLLIAFLHYAITYFTHGAMIQKLDQSGTEENA